MAIPQLTLGSFNLTDWSGSTYGTSVIAQGTSRGAPVPIEVAVQTWLQDGSVVVTQGYDNRTVSLRVKLRAPSLTAVATAEAALFAQLGKPNTLTWTPATGPAAVFDVITSSMDESPAEDGDLAEMQAFPWRTYDLRLTCAAFTRSATETVTAALPATGTTTTLVNDGSATTGWTGAVNGVTTAPTVVSGAVKVTNAAVVLGAVVCSLTYTASITTSATKYIQVDHKPESSAGSPTLRAYGDGIELTRLAETVSPTAGYTRTTFGPVAASSIAVLRLDSTSGVDFGSVFYPGAVRSLYVDNINRTDVTPSLGTGRQLLRSITVAGSARTQGSVAIEHATSALGDVLAYFFPDSPNTTGNSPSLRQYFVSGGSQTSDSAMVSGARNDNAITAQVYDVPVSKLARSLHTLVIKGAGGFATTVAVSWSAQLRINGTNVGPAQSFSATRAVTTSQAFYTLGRMVMPPGDLSEANTNGVVRITINSSLTALDEAWLFSDLGRLVGPVSCGTASPASGGAANRIFLEPATPGMPRPTIRIGFAADRSDAYFPSATSLGLGFLAGWELPEFNPPRVNVLTVTTNALDCSVTLRHYPRWHTNPAA